MVLAIQVAGALFGAAMLYFSFTTYKRKEFNRSEGAVWAVVWILFITVSLFPELLQPVVKTLELYRTMDLFTILGFIFLITLTFYNYALLKQNKKKLEDVVREVAITRAKK